MQQAAKTLVAPAFKHKKLALVVLLAMLVIGGVGISRRAQPPRFPLTPGTETIVFISGRDRAINLYAIRPDGTYETRLTDFRLRSSRWWFPSFLIPYGDATTNGDPQLAPDGQSILFTSNFEGDELLYQMHVDGSGLQRLDMPIVRDAAAVVSPNGQWIAYVKDDRHVMVMRRDGSGERCLSCTLPRTPFRPAWSPDSQQLVMLSQHGKQTSLYRVNVDGTDLVRLTNTPSATDSAPAWSPDGRQIAFGSTPKQGRTSMYVMNADGSNQHVLTTTGDGYDPAWSPDGQRIAFVSSRAEVSQEIYVMNADGSNPTRLTFNAAFDTDPIWIRIPDEQP